MRRVNSGTTISNRSTSNARVAKRVGRGGDRDVTNSGRRSIVATIINIVTNIVIIKSSTGN